MAFTTDYLLDDIKKRGVIPANQLLVNGPDILRIATGVMIGKIVPLVKSFRAEYFVKQSYLQFVASQAEYDIPYRSIGRTMRDVFGVSYTGTTLTGEEWDIPYIDPEYAHLYKNGDKPVGFTLRADKIVPLPLPTTTTYGLRTDWYLPPSRLCEVTAAAPVASVAGNDVVCTSVPAAITAGSVVDIIQGRAGHSSLALDVTVTNKDGVTLTFAAGVVPSSLRSGDWICLAETAPVVMLPDDVFPLLVSMTCQRILKLQGDSEGAADLKDDIAEETAFAKQNLTTRVEGEPKRYVNRDGLLRRGGVSRKFMFRHSS